MCRKSIKKVLEVLLVKQPLAEHWALPGVSYQAVCPSSVLHPVHPLTERTPVTCDYSLDSSGLCPWLLMTEPRTWPVFRP